MTVYLIDLVPKIVRLSAALTICINYNDAASPTKWLTLNRRTGAPGILLSLAE